MSSTLKQIRQNMGISQSELAEISGVNLRSLQDYEQGRKTLFSASGEMLYRLSFALNCSINDLLIDVSQPIDSDLKLSALDRNLRYFDSLNERILRGCVDVEIDTLTPCLVDCATGKICETVVYRIETKSALAGYSKKSGWNVNWSKLPKGVEIYALATLHDGKIQGLVGVTNDEVSQAAYIVWMSAAPHNNKKISGYKKYEGVGGHLFAIVAKKSRDWGYAGVMHGFAANRDLLQHYCDAFGAEYLGVQHDYQFMLREEAALELLEVYDAEWE